MNFYLLDAAAPGLIFGAMIIFMLITITLEAVTMIIMKYNKAGKAFLDSLLINLASMAVGFLILLSGEDLLGIVDSSVLSIAILFLITVIVEFLVLWLLNRKIPVQKTILVSFVINIISYLLFYLVSFGFSN
jgi:hypothetical protein